MEVYMDNMLVKSIQANDHIVDLSEAFDMLRRYGMKLNPSKCAFGVSSRKLLVFIFSWKRIEANPKKIKAILDMQVP
jgi:hypothetical protein